MPHPRIAGKLGRRDARNPVQLRWLADYLVNPLPVAPRTLDHTVGVKGFAMYGNDRYGDCTFAGMTNLRAADAHLLAETETWPSAQQVIDAYLAYTGGQDEGAVEADLLLAWRRQPILGATIAGYAPLHVSQHATLKSAMALFGGAYVGVQVPAPAMTQFRMGQPWHLTGTRADNDIEGGHCVPLLGYAAEGPLCVTWGHVQHISWKWWDRYADEAWAVLTHEFVAAKPGLVDVAAMQADIAKLGGTS